MKGVYAWEGHPHKTALRGLSPSLRPLLEMIVDDIEIFGLARVTLYRGGGWMMAM